MTQTNYRRTIEQSIVGLAQHHVTALLCIKHKNFKDAVLHLEQAYQQIGFINDLCVLVEAVSYDVGLCALHQSLKIIREEIREDLWIANMAQMNPISALAH